MLTGRYKNRNIITTPPNLRMGLGSVYKDPRFQPGPEATYPGGGGYSPAPDTHAGGDTLGALAPSVFAPGTVWDTTYVKGFGGQYGPDWSIRPIPVEVAITASR